MKILIIEDDQPKLNNIVGALTELEDISLDDIDHVADAISGKRFLKEHTVDFIVLDLHLPGRVGAKPKPTGGLDFISSIANRPTFFVPSHVVAISGNPEAITASAERAGELWGVIHYEAADVKWRKELQSRARYAIAAWKSALGRPRQTRPGDVAIVTALDEELEGILRLPLGWREYKHDGDPTIYHEGELFDNDRKLRVVAASTGRMGMSSTAALSSKVIDLYRPKYLAMAGITGGIRGRVDLGDILVADPSWDWGAGKYEVVDGKPRFAANPEQLRISPDIRPLIMKASKDASMLDAIKASYPGTKPHNSLKCHVEAVASGAAVLGDEEIVEGIKQQNRKLHGVEMEIFGLMMAAEVCSKPRPIAFSVKAVSDFADTTKDDDTRAYAIHASSEFLRGFLRTFILPSFE